MADINTKMQEIQNHNLLARARSWTLILSIILVSLEKFILRNTITTLYSAATKLSLSQITAAQFLRSPIHYALKKALKALYSSYSSIVHR